MCTPLNNILTVADGMLSQQKPARRLYCWCHEFVTLGQAEGHGRVTSNRTRMLQHQEACRPCAHHATTVLTAADVMLGQRKAHKAPLLLLSQVCHTWPSRGSREGIEQAEYACCRTRKHAHYVYTAQQHIDTCRCDARPTPSSQGAATAVVASMKKN
jgi:hypothetical protein